MPNLALKENENSYNVQCGFETLLNELAELEAWEEKYSNSAEEIASILQNKTGQKKQLLKKIIQRLKKETDIESRLHGLVDLSVIEDLQQYIDDSTFIYETEFEEKNRKAQYYAGFIVLAKADYDRDEQALKDLANGYLPDDFVSIFHEKIHRTQRGLRRWLKKPDESQLILEDVHAYKGENEVYPFGSLTGCYLDQISQDPAIGHDLSVDEIRDRVIMACSQIERLMAQGVTHKQIGKMVQKTHWDASKACFERLGDKGSKDNDSLVDKMRLQRKITMLKIKRIAQEEIINSP